MDIVFHIGAHNTDESMIVKSLIANADLLAGHGILVPEQARYRTVLSEALQKLRGSLASEEVQDVVLDTILEDADGQRLLFSNENFACMPSAVFADGPFYDRLPRRAAWLRNIFPDFDVTIAIGLRDPATLAPELYRREKTPPPFEQWKAQIDWGSVSWLRVIQEVQAQLPDTPLLLWCNEDTPLIWPEVVQALTGHPDGLALEDQDVLLQKIMTPRGLDRMRGYLAEHPPRSIEQRRRITAAFLDKFALEDALEEEIDLPGWTEDIMDALSERYEADVDLIAQLPGVRFILP